MTPFDEDWQLDARASWDRQVTEEGEGTTVNHALRVYTGERGGHWCNASVDQREAARRFLLDRWEALKFVRDHIAWKAARTPLDTIEAVRLAAASEILDPELERQRALAVQGAAQSLLTIGEEIERMAAQNRARKQQA